MSEPRYIDPIAVVEVVEQPSQRYKERGAWATSFMIDYSTPIPMTTRWQTQRYRVYSTKSAPPFIMVRGDRLYLTPELAEKVKS